MSDTLCPAPWEHHCINTNGRNRLCCNAVTSETKFLDGFEDYWTSKEVQDVRDQMIKGERPDACVSCWKKEDAGIKSLRQGMTAALQSRGREWEKFTSNLNYVPKYPIHLDLKLGNYCNLSCRMCSSYSSSSYATEFQRILKDTGIDLGINDYEKYNKQSKWYNDPRFVNTIKSMIDNGLRHLKFTGGEPLMVPSVKKLLDYCIEKNKAKDIELVLITNGTLLNQSWIDLFSHFSDISIIFSIDGTKDIFEYIRHPAKWHVIIDKLNLLKSNNDNKFSSFIAFTYQIYNILETKNMIELTRKYNAKLSAIILDTPDYLDVSYAPEKLKQHAINVIENITPQNKTEKTFLRDCKNAIVRNTYDYGKSKYMIEVSKLKDEYKKQNFDLTEIAKYYG